MLGKIEILIVIIFILFAFYFVISLGASNKGKASKNIHITRYMKGVRILIIIIAAVSLILWVISFNF